MHGVCIVRLVSGWTLFGHFNYHYYDYVLHVTDTAKSLTIQTSHFILSTILPVLYTILNVFSDGELSDSEWLNLTQLTVDGHVNIIVDNTDTGIH